MNEYDFNLEDTDQKYQQKLIPPSIVSPYQSLVSSRSNLINPFRIQIYTDMYKNQTYQDSQDQRMTIPFPTNKNLQQYQKQKTQSVKIQKQVQTHINKAKKNGFLKNFNQFLQNQKKYEERVHQKLIKLRQQKQNIERQPVTFKPKISQKSKNLNKQNKIPVFQRLFKNKEEDKKFSQSKLMFHPQISQKSKKIQRQEPVQQILYRDAKLRQQKLYQSISAKDEMKTPCSPTNYSSNNPKSQYLLINKFLKQYLEVLQDPQFVNIFEKPISSKMEKSTFQRILYRLGFISSLGQSKDSKIINDAYNELDKNEVNLVNLFTFLLSVIGIQKISLAQLQLLGDSNKFLMRTQIEAKSIHHRFNELFQNRLCHQHQNKYFTQYPFKPYLSPQSSKLAEKHRRQLLSSAEKLKISSPKNKQLRKMSHSQLLNLNQRLKQHQLQKQRILQYERMMKQCTFKPKVSNFRRVSQFELKSRRQSKFTQQNISSSSINKSQLRQNPVELSQIKNISQPVVVILDINFGGYDQQITLRKEDQTNLVSIANFYANKYEIDEQSQQQLLLMLNTQYNSVFSSNY